MKTIVMAAAAALAGTLAIAAPAAAQPYGYGYGYAPSPYYGAYDEPRGYGYPPPYYGRGRYYPQRETYVDAYGYAHTRCRAHRGCYESGPNY